MIQFLKILGVMSLLAVIATAFFPEVTELPFGMDEAFIIFVGGIKGLISLLPWMEIVWNCLLIALGVDILLFTWHWVHTIINLLRG